jgi:predicted nucleotidyltransferase
MITQDSLRAHREEIISLGTRYGAFNFRIFGSVARGDSTERSDIDLLVEFEPGRSLLDQGGLLMDLRDLLGINVDLIEEGQLSGRLAQFVRKEAVPL